LPGRYVREPDRPGWLADQAALFGLLARLRDLGATLLLVERLTFDHRESL
jgi:excinuclease UvrABC ATPase subunit